MDIKYQICETCEQPFSLDKTSCPHCHRFNQIELETSESYEQRKNRLLEKIKKHKEEEDISDLAHLIYLEGMKNRYESPSVALELFEQVLKHKPDHIEAALKVSWLSIRFGNYFRAKQVLYPIVERQDATDLQKQRACTNLSCSSNWENPSNPVEAEKWAWTGIKEYGETAKLWENLATSYKLQGKYEEARQAFKTALKLNPKSTNAIERQASVERHLKLEEKHRNKRKSSSGSSSSKLKWKLSFGFPGGGESKKKNQEFEKL
eukprot:TRINITY_DN406_c0_g1_i1.p1 TRINITY_DN406_c0_g1~~TRINITY_DN406_c0_g1_i1.p1  ORF type:complete len:263 (-),score=45.48 TRINITY_DN406_c0_g1_i1:285-1073(-)